MFKEQKKELDTVDKENEEIRRAIRQLEDKNDNYKRARLCQT